MKIQTGFVRSFIIIVVILISQNAQAGRKLLNVSYDPTRELYQEFNQAFIKYWEAKTKETVSIEQSHGGAGKQAKAVIDGLEADVLTLAISYDIDQLSQKSKLLPANWQSRLPYNSTPYTSTIVFLVRKGNPKKIKDWGDLIKPSVSVVTPNPKTSGGARYNYLAAWNYAEKTLGNKEAAKGFMRHLFKHVPVLDTGARGATLTFIERGIGDVLLAWENEALLTVKELNEGEFEIVVPSSSILAEPPVAVVDSIVDKHKTRDLAEAYLQYLYTPVGQKLAAKYYYRPILPALVDAKELAAFPKLKLSSIAEIAGSWDKAQKEHFDDGGTFDQIYAP
jgi:sulfate transport system substrate-binding protein